MNDDASVPDGSNFFASLDTDRSKPEIARLYEASGWQVRNCSRVDCEVRCPWAELVIDGERPVLLHGPVADVLTRAPQVVAPLRAAGIAYRGECYGTDKLLLRQFVWPVSTLLRINGQALPLERAWWPEMSLSSARKGRSPLPYVLTLDRECLCAELDAPYAHCVHELQLDDQSSDDPDFFGRAGYPPLAQLLQEPELLTRVIQIYFAQQVFDAALPPRGPMAIYAIDGIDSVGCDDNGHVVVQGICYPFNLPGQTGPDE